MSQPPLPPPATRLPLPSAALPAWELWPPSHRQEMVTILAILVEKRWRRTSQEAEHDQPS